MEQNKTLSLSLEYILELIIQSEESYRAARELVLHFSEKEEYGKNEYVFSLACELVWLNYSTLKLITQEIETAALVKHEDKTSGTEMIILEETLQILQSMLISRHLATNELNRVSYSTSMH
jgi:hypothetical protein